MWTIIRICYLSYLGIVFVASYNHSNVEPLKKLKLNDVEVNITRVNTMLQKLIRKYEQFRKSYADTVVSEPETDEVTSIENGKSAETDQNVDNINKKVFVLQDNNKFQTTKRPIDIPNSYEFKTPSRDNQNVTPKRISVLNEPENDMNDRLKDQEKSESSESTQEVPQKFDGEYSKSFRVQSDSFEHTEATLQTVTANKLKLNSQSKNQSPMIRVDVIPNKTGMYEISIKKSLANQIRATLENDKAQNYRVLPQISRLIIGDKQNTTHSSEEIYQRAQIETAPNRKTKDFIVMDSKKLKELEDVSKVLESNQDDSEEEMKVALTLRQMYCDACVKVVVRKCYKACKETKKEVCRKFTCQSSYKSVFDKESRLQCIYYFQRQTSRKQDNPTSFLNETGIDTACCPTLTQDSRNTMNSNLSRNLAQLDEQFQPIGILRNKYERECGRVSAKRCTKACLDAHRAAERKATKPNKRRVNKFKKVCKTKCIEKFKSRQGSKKSFFSDDSDSDSDPGSSSSGSFTDWR